MPAKFNKCVSGGGRVRTVTPKRGVSIKVCFPKGGGPSVRGEVHRKKKK